MILHIKKYLYNKKLQNHIKNLNYDCLCGESVKLKNIKKHIKKCNYAKIEFEKRETESLNETFVRNIYENIRGG